MSTKFSKLFSIKTTVILLCVGFLVFANTALASSALVAQWKFDDGTGITAIDSTSNANNGTLSGSILPAWQTADQCHSGTCLYFDGSHSYVGMGNVALYNTLSSGTIDLWFKVTGGAGTYKTLFNYSASTGSKTYDLMTIGIKSSNQVYFVVRNSSGTELINAYTTSGTINLNQWYNVAVTVGSSGNILYLDNIAQTLTYGSGTSATQAFFNNVSSSANTYIGTDLYANGLENYFPGYIDEIQIYSSALTSSQISDIFNTGSATFPPTMSGVNALYTMTVGNIVSITPSCSDMTGTITYSSDDSTFWNSGTHTWSFTPIFEDGGTIKNITFTCTNGTSTLTTSTKVVTYRDFSNLQKYSGNPVIPLNAGHGTDAPYIRSSQTIGGTYYSVTQNNDSTDTWPNLALYTSTDLKNWTTYANNPVLTASLGQWDDHYLGHPAIIKIGSTWYMYYSGMNSSGTESIGLATSTDFIHWTKYGSNPLITPDVAIPGVIKIGSTYYIYVANRPFGHTISYYTSSDGINWTLGGNAITTGGSDWDTTNSRLNDPFVIQNSLGFYEMAYTAEFTSGPFDPQEIGYAVSSDGINWYKYAGTILKGSGISGSFDQRYPGDAVLLPYENYIYFYYAGANASYLSQGGLSWIQSTTSGAYKNIDTTFYADGTATYSASPNGFTNANLVATPSAGTATVTVTTYNLSAGNNNTLIAFNANSTNGNNVTFTINGLSSNTVYSINQDGLFFTVATSNSGGQITFSNSSWSQHTFTIYEDTTAPTSTALPLGGYYATTQSVTLSCADNVGGAGCDKIYYTTNGDVPTTGSTEYATPITISATTTLKFFSTDLNGESETVQTETYTIGTNLITEEQPENANITSWKASEYQKPDSSCQQRLKLEIKGKHFDKNVEVKIGNKEASSIDRKSSKEITAKFCLAKLLNVKTDLERTISVTNPDADRKKADKKINLDNLTPQIISDSLNTQTVEGVKNIQRALVKLGLLDQRYITGFYGPITTEAVRKFQEQNGIDQTGTVGPITRAKLVEKMK